MLRIPAQTETVFTDKRQPLIVPRGFTEEARGLFASCVHGRRLVVLTPSDSPVLRTTAEYILTEVFRAKDQDPRSKDPTAEPPHYVLLIEEGLHGPVPVGAHEIAINRVRPPDSISDIEHVFEQDIARLCARTTMANGQPLPNLKQHFRRVAGLESVGVWPEYSFRRDAPYVLLMYAQVIQLVVALGFIDVLAAVLDMRKGAAFTQIQRHLGQTFSFYGNDPNTVPSRVYWAGGSWAQFNNRTVPTGENGQPTVVVPNYSKPVFADLWGWLGRLRTGSPREQGIYNRLLGNGYDGIAMFDSRYRPHSQAA